LDKKTVIKKYSGMYLIGKKEFIKNAKKGKVSYLLKKLDGFNLTPRQAYRSLGLEKNCVLLESAGPTSMLARYSFLCFDSFATLKYKNNKSCFSCDGNDEVKEMDPFSCLRHYFNRFYSPYKIKRKIPYFGGPVGYLSYDIARLIEKIPSISKADLALDELSFIFPSQIIIFDHQFGNTYLAVNQVVQNNIFKAFNCAQSKMKITMEQLTKKSSEEEIFCKDGKASYSVTQSHFEKSVKKIKEYIYAGDVYQVNLSLRTSIPFKGSSFGLYNELMRINPSPFSAFLSLDDLNIASSSPERLIQLKDNFAQSRPIAGTRRRGFDLREDLHLSGNMLLDTKEQAEHVMLVDLQRNDLGRVCDYGTVAVSELMTVEKYSHVMHIVSNVVGRLNNNHDAFNLLKAVFPGGTITGCPKVRCMEIIEELEGIRRGPYTGSIGYFASNGNCDFNIIIRTFILKDGQAHIQAGAGIVADSVAKREYYECLSKAGAALNCFGVNVKERQWEKLSI